MIAWTFFTPGDRLRLCDLSLDRARAIGKAEIDGPRDLVRAMPRWFGRSKFADDNPLPVA